MPDIGKGDRVRVTRQEADGLPVDTLGEVFWAGRGHGGRQRVGVEADRTRSRKFMNASSVERLGGANAQATEATQEMAAHVWELLRGRVPQIGQQTLPDGSITVTGRVLIRDEQHSDALDTLPADIHGVFPNIRYQVKLDENTGLTCYHFNCLASREVA